MGDGSLQMVIFFATVLLLGAATIAPFCRYIQQRSGFIQSCSALPLSVALFACFFSLYCSVGPEIFGHFLGSTLFLCALISVGWILPYILTKKDDLHWEELSIDFEKPFVTGYSISHLSQPMRFTKIVEHLKKYRCVFLPTFHSGKWAAIFLFYFFGYCISHALNSDIFLTGSDAESLGISAVLQRSLQGIEKKSDLLSIVSPLDYVSFQMGAPLLRLWAFMSGDSNPVTSGGIAFHTISAAWKAIGTNLLFWTGFQVLKPFFNKSLTLLSVSFSAAFLFLICGFSLTPSEGTLLATTVVFLVLLKLWLFHLYRTVGFRLSANVVVWVLLAFTFGLSFLGPVNFGSIFLIFSSVTILTLALVAFRKQNLKTVIVGLLPLNLASILGVIIGSAVFPEQNLFSGKPLFVFLSEGLGTAIFMEPTHSLKIVFYIANISLFLSALPFYFITIRHFYRILIALGSTASLAATLFFLTGWVSWALSALIGVSFVALFCAAFRRKLKINNYPSLISENIETTSLAIALGSLPKTQYAQAYNAYSAPLLNVTRVQRQFLTPQQWRLSCRFIKPSFESVLGALLLMALFLGVRGWILHSFTTLLYAQIFLGFAFAAVLCYFWTLQNSMPDNPVSRTKPPSVLFDQLPVFLSVCAILASVGFAVAGYSDKLKKQTSISGNTLQGYLYLQKIHPYDSSLIKGIHSKIHASDSTRLHARHVTEVSKPVIPLFTVGEVLELCSQDKIGRILPGRISVLLGLRSFCLPHNLTAAALANKVFKFVSENSEKSGENLPGLETLRSELWNSKISHLIVGESERDTYGIDAKSVAAFFGTMAVNGSEYGLVELKKF